MPRCCAIIPTYCEARHLPLLVPRVFAQEPQLAPYELWVAIVDDDSPDETGAVLETLGAQYPRLRVLHGPKRGLGIAYQRGFAFARQALHADLLVQMDGDLQHDPDALPELVRRCQLPVAAVVGSRFAPGGATPAFSRRRRWTSQTANWLIHRYSGLPYLYDYTSGFRCLNGAAAEQALARCSHDHLATRGYAFQTSLIAELLLSGAPVLETPIVFGQRQFGDSKLRRADYLEFARNLPRLRARRQRPRAAARGHWQAP